MDALRAAVPLARALLSLAYAKRSGSLHVQVGFRRATVELSQGAVVSLVGVDGELLGDALLREGELDSGRHGAALSEAEPEGPVGRWLVAIGAASREAVDRALVAQLERRLGALLRFAGASLRFEELRAQTLAMPSIVAAVAPSVWSGLLTLAAELTHDERAQLAGQGGLRLTRAGTQFVAALNLSGRPLEIDAVLRREHGHEPARAALRALGLAVDGRVDADAFSLLLRKQREIRRHASAEALLDLPPRPAPEQARRALRRLAQKLHPDRFSGELPALRAVSSEVMRALFRAEEALRDVSLSRHVSR